MKILARILGIGSLLASTLSLAPGVLGSSPAALRWLAVALAIAGAAVLLLSAIRALHAGSLKDWSLQAIALVVSFAVVAPSLRQAIPVAAAPAATAASRAVVTGAQPAAALAAPTSTPDAHVSALPPVAAPADLTDESTAARASLAEKRWQLSARADDLAPGHEAAFAFVRDYVGIDAYPGVLRGARGAFLSRRGNAWDRALLLQLLLKRKGIQARLARGRLEGDTLDRAFARVFDAVHPAPGDTASKTPAPSPLGDRIRARASRDYGVLTRALGTTALTDQESRDRSRADLADHVWVQAQLDGTWTDLDPLLADSAPGHRYCESTGTFDGPPTSAYQRVGIRVVADVLSNGFVTDRTLLQFYGNAADLLGQPIFLMHAPPQGANGALGRLTGSGWRPMLYVNGQFVRGDSVPFTPSSDAGAFFSGSDGTLVNESLEMAITLPDGHKDVSTRRLVSRGGEDARRAGHLTDADLSPLPGNNQGPLAAQAIHLIWLTAGMHNLVAYADGLHDLARALAPDANGRMTPPPSPQDAMWALAVGMFPLVLWSEHMVLPSVDSDAGVRAYADSPRVIVMTRHADGRDAKRSVTDYDLLRDRIRAVAKEPGGTHHAAERRMWFGAIEGALEHELSAQIVADAGGHDADLLSTSGLLSDRGVVRLDAASADQVKTLAGSGDRALRMTAALGHSAVMVVPKPAEGQPARGWWEISADGTTRALIDEGLGGSSYSLGSLNPADYFRVARSARPGGEWEIDPKTLNDVGRRRFDGSWEDLRRPPAQRGGGNEYTILLTVVSLVAVAAWTVVSIEVALLCANAIRALHELPELPNAFGI